MKLSMTQLGFIVYVILIFIGIIAAVFADKAGIFALIILSGWIVPYVGYICD